MWVRSPRPVRIAAGRLLLIASEVTTRMSVVLAVSDVDVYDT